MLLALTLLSNTAVAAVILVALLGLTGFTVNPVLPALAERFAGNAQTLTAPLTVSAFNAGIGVGSSTAGATLTHRSALSAPPSSER